MTVLLRNSFVAATVALLATGLTFGLSAGPALASPGASVPIAPAELMTPAGRDAVDARIARAAERACRFEAHERDLAQRGRAHRCVTESIADARARLAEMRMRGMELAAR
jgi:UrcA family protein